MTKLMFLSLMIMLVGGSLSAVARAEEREEVRKSFDLNPDAQVKVSGINGPVTIETGSGKVAEVYIERIARNREDLEYSRVIIEGSGNSLTIRGEKLHDSDWEGGRRPQVRHRVILKLPRAVNLNVNGVNGTVNVAEIEGKAEVSGINGSVTFTQAAQFSSISGINGKVSVGMARIGEGGLRISGINGGVECRIGEGINADLKASGINGSVQVNLADITMEGEIARNKVNAKIGAGGPPINVSGINGSVRFNPLN